MQIATIAMPRGEFFLAKAARPMPSPIKANNRLKSEIKPAVRNAGHRLAIGGQVAGMVIFRIGDPN